MEGDPVHCGLGGDLSAEVDEHFDEEEKHDFGGKGNIGRVEGPKDEGQRKQEKRGKREEDLASQDIGKVDLEHFHLV